MRVLVTVVAGLVLGGIAAWWAFVPVVPTVGPPTMRTSLALRALALGGSSALVIDVNPTPWPGWAVSGAILVTGWSIGWACHRRRPAETVTGP